MPGGSTRTQDPINRGNARTVPAHTGGEYWRLSTRPLHILVFLLPMLILYEVGAALYADGRIVANTLLSNFFDLFGAPALALHAPPIVLATILLIWHVLIRDRWKIQAYVLPGMLLESIAWTMPLVVLAVVLGPAQQATPLARLFSGGLPALAAVDLHELSWQSRLTVAVGAGLYEEMLFRLIGIALLHFVIKDLLGATERRASILAVVGAALAFAVYHNLALPGFAWTFDGLSHGVAWRLALFYFAAGFYLGAVYVTRGFGIVVATHCLFDVVALFL